MSGETPTKSGATRKPAYKRRAFPDSFKRRVVNEAARTSIAAVINKYKLPGSSREWHKEFPAKAPTKAGAAKRANGAAPLGPTREAIVYLKHAEKAFGEGKQKRGKLLAQLALSTLLGD